MHNSGMRTHTQIVRDAGEEVIASDTGAPVLTVRSWAQRNSIPAKEWAALIAKKRCTADELIKAAAARKAA